MKEAEAAGFTIEEVLRVSKKRTRAKLTAKYRNPGNPAQNPVDLEI